MASREEYLGQLADCVLNMEDEAVVPVAEAYIKAGHAAVEGISEGLVNGMNKAGQLYEADEYFVSDLLLCSDAMYAGLDVLKPHVGSEDAAKGKAAVVIGVVEGDTHDIGKNLVKIMLESAGCLLYDLGRDVPAQAFVDKVRETGAALVCLSTLMTTTMPQMALVIDRLKEENMRDKVVVMVGGGPLSSAYAAKIGADAYGRDAVEAVKVAKRLLAI
ncbi:MAG: corrinoid protein [Peptococcaceae bacterium]|nr:corrinoid protein [Peptococcaceae bacterium]